MAKQCAAYTNNSILQNPRANQISYATLRSQVSKAATSDIEMTLLSPSLGTTGTTSHSQSTHQSYSNKQNSTSISTNLVLSGDGNQSKPISTHQSDDNFEQTEPLSSDSNSYLPSLIAEHASVEKKDTEEKDNTKKDIKTASIKDYVFCVSSQH